MVDVVGVRVVVVVVVEMMLFCSPPPPPPRQDVYRLSFRNGMREN